MASFREQVSSLWHNRWIVLVASIWIQACAGVGYAFGSFSPLIKRSLNYNQKQLSRLGVAKDLGDSVGLVAGSLCEILPPWAMLLLGGLQNFVCYGWLWLIVTGKVFPLPLWMICILIFVGTNGETYFNTTALVTCVRNFPKNRGPIVGILKGFTGLCGAIFTQIYTAFLAPDQAAFIFIVAVGPAMVACAVMFIIRPIDHEHWNDINSETVGFRFIYGVCLVLAAYLMGVFLLQDLVPVSDNVSLIFTAVLIFLLVLPLATPFISAWFLGSNNSTILKYGSFGGEKTLVSSLLAGSTESKPSGRDVQEQSTSTAFHSEAFGFSELEDEKPKEIDLLPEPIRRLKLAALRNRLWQAAAEGAVRVKPKRGPRRGQDFTLVQAVIKADFWLLFFALLCGAGSGLTVIDNIGQMAEAQGYLNSHIFVSMISIWNFLGRLAGGQASEVIARDYAMPRPLTMALAQMLMAVGHFLFALACPGSLYAGTLLVGLGYGAHWAIVPATASELFGLKNFGILYNFITMANPAGSLLFSGIIAGSVYDWHAEKQKQITDGFMLQISGGQFVKEEQSLQCKGAVCFYLTFLIMTAVCIVGVFLSLVLAIRTRIVYTTIYGKPEKHPQPEIRPRMYEIINEEEGDNESR